MSDPSEADIDAFLAEDAPPTDLGDAEVDAFLAEDTPSPTAEPPPAPDIIPPWGDFVAPTGETVTPSPADVSDYPQLAKVVEVEKRVSGLTRALKMAGQSFDDFTSYLAKRVEELDPEGTKAYRAELAAMTPGQRADYDASLGRSLPFDPGQAAADLAKSLAGMDVAPKKVLEADTPEAAAVRAEGGAAVVAQRWREAQRGLEVSALSYQELLGVLGGSDTSEVRARREALEAELPLNLREEGFLGLLASVTAGSAPTVRTLVEAGAGGAAGAAGAGLGTLLATKSPAAASEAATLGLKVGGAAGAASSTFVLEAGSTFRESAGWKTAAGDTLTPEERAGAAVVAGALKTGIELLEVATIAKVLGPAASAAAGGEAASLRLEVARNPGIRALLVRAAKAWAKVTGAEALEESAQTLVDQAAETATTGTAAWDPAETIESAVEAAKVAGLTFGLAGATLQAGVEAQALREQQKAAAAVPSILALAADPAMQDAPGEFAQLAEEASGKKALYVSGDAVRRFFQERGDEAAAAEQLEAALGPGAAEKVAEAVASGGMVEVPLLEVPRWASSEAAKALADDTATHPEHRTPRELREQGAALEQQARAVAEAELSKYADAQALDEQVRTWETQLVEAGRSRREAKVEATLLRHFVATAAKDSGTLPTEVFADVSLSFGRGTGQAMQDGAESVAQEQDPARLAIEREHEQRFADIKAAYEEREAAAPQQDAIDQLEAEQAAEVDAAIADYEATEERLNTAVAEADDFDEDAPDAAEREANFKAVSKAAKLELRAAEKERERRITQSEARLEKERKRLEREEQAYLKANDEAYEKAFDEVQRSLDTRLAWLDRKAERAQRGPGVVAQDTPGTAPKGYTELPEARAAKQVVRVFLNPSADASTVVHEAAHAFLELYRHLAAKPEATAAVRAKWDAVRGFLQLDEGARVTREQHEKFARSFEAYLFEGKAPKKGLERVFASLERWLLSIYRTVAAIPGAVLNDEARAVFGSLLATEDEVAAYRRAQGPAAVEPTREEAEVELEQLTEGGRRAALAAARDALRTRERWWKDGLAKLRRAVEADYDELPAVRAKLILSGRTPGGRDESPLPLHRESVEAVLGKGVALPGIELAGEGEGVRPGAVAEFVGLKTGEELVRALAELPARKDWVEAEAQAEMRRLHPGILERRDELRTLIADGLHGYTERRLLDERAAFRKKDATLGAAPVEALKRAAALIVERTQVGRLRPGLALARAKVAAQRALAATAKGEWAKAGQANQEQLLNHYLHAELRQAVEERAKLEDVATALSKPAARARLGKASPAYRDAVDWLLSSLKLAAPGTERLDADALQAAVAQLQGDAVVVGDPDWLLPVLEALRGAQDVRQLTVAQLRAVREAVDMLRTGARQRTEVLVDDKAADLEATVEAVLGEMEQALPDRGPLVAKGTATKLEWLKEEVNALDGYLVGPTDIVRDLVGDDQQSTLWRAVVNPLRRALIREADLLHEVVQPIAAAFADMPRKVRDGLMDPIDGRALFPDHIPDFRPRRRFELLALALNSGSESSLRVVTEGRRITLEQIREALNLLTAEEVAWVNTVLKAAEALREPAFALEERETGIRPRAVEAVPMQLTNGRLQGGYFPLKAVREGSNVGERMAANEMAALFDPSFTKPVTAHGHLKSRTGATYPVELDLNVILRHLGQVTHDIAFREPVKSVARLLMDERVRKQMQQRAGVAKEREFLLWLKDIGGGGSALIDSPVARMVAWAKANMVTSLLSGLSTAFGNLANLPTAVASTKLQSKHLAAAVTQVAARPLETRRVALEKSGVLRASQLDVVQGFEKEMASITKDDWARRADWFKEAGMAAMRGVDAIVTTAVWTGAYRQALADGLEEGPAVRWADDIVTQVQPQSSPVEKARILRDRGPASALVMFYGYLSVAYRAQHRIGMPLAGRAFREGTPAQQARILGRTAGGLLAFWVSYQVLGELLMGRGPEDGDDDKEDPGNKALRWRNWFLRKLAVAPLSTLPVVPEMAAAVDAAATGKRLNPRTNPLGGLVLQTGRAGAAVVKLMMGEGDIDKATSEALRAMGLYTGLPTRLVDTTGGYLLDVATGEEQPDNLGDFVSGFIYGERPRQPDNAFKAAP